jgi:hypothetical protein
VTLNQKHWKSFCKTLEGLALRCHDADINDGIIRQRSNDHSGILEINLRSVVGRSTFTIVYFKEKLKILSTLTGPVTIKADSEEVLFSDGTSSYAVDIPKRDYLDNTFMGQQELDSFFPGIARNIPLLIRNTIEKEIRKRIRIALAKLNSNTYKVVFTNHTASLGVEKQSGNPNGPIPYVEVIRDIPLFQPTTGFTSLPPLAFHSPDCDADMGWEVYRVGKKLLSINSGHIGNITSRIYTKGDQKNNPPHPLPETDEIPEGEEVSPPESQA